MVLLTIPLMACDQVGDILILPEFDLSYSFESGLDGWFGNGVDLTDPIVTWSVETSNEQASDGANSAKLFVDNRNGMSKIWLERAVDVSPNLAYDIDISFDFLRDRPTVIFSLAIEGFGISQFCVALEVLCVRTPRFSGADADSLFLRSRR